MTRAIPLAALVALACCGAWAQPAADSPAFEVASVKPSPPPAGRFAFSTMRGGPGSDNPTRFEGRSVTLEFLLSRAYGVSGWQIVGPDWIFQEKFDIDAKVPSGATREEFRAMLGNLLAERFKMQIHRDAKEMTLYSLTVAKGGEKLTPHVEAPQPGGNPARATGGAPKGCLQKYGADLEWLVASLPGYLGAPVRDDTGLKGNYDITLCWVVGAPSAAPDTDTGPDLFVALQEQLGLKLERKKGPLEMVVIDHAEKVPTAN
jgi:uncharacterized protein (TIGR03435 family)